MKSSIFLTAIRKKVKVKFLYKFKEIVLDPYFITINMKGHKCIVGKIQGTNTIKEFEFYQIVNIKILRERFVPIIPLAVNYY